MTEADYFRLCSSCKTPIGFGQTYYVCSVSTCNRKRTGLTFCQVPCFEAHLPEMRHREAWAEEERAPSREAFAAQQAEERQKEADKADKAEARQQRGEARRHVSTALSPATADHLQDDVPRDILIVVSKLKNYIRARSGMNTSDGVTEVLSDIVRDACDQAIREARRAERKTVMARDFNVD